MTPSDPDYGPHLDTLLGACIHCGLCLDTCPTFLVTGEEAESPRGRLLLMRGLVEGRWLPGPEVLDHLDLCLGCRACESACPSGVQYGEILETTRAAVHRARRVPRDRFETLLVRWVLPRGRMLELLAPGYRLLRPWRWSLLFERLPLSPTWRRRLRLIPEAESPVTPDLDPRHAGREAVLLRGCVARALFPATETAMRTLLDRAGYRVRVLQEPDCCGALEQHLGHREDARKRARELLGLLEGSEGPVIATAAGCGAHLEALGELFAGEPEETAARRLAARAMDLSEALLEGPAPLRFKPGTTIPVTLQDACHLRHGQRVTEAPRELLRRAGARLRESAEAELCCGSAGTYNLSRGAMADVLGERKASVLRRTGAEVIVTMNPGCAIQLRAHLGPEDPPVVTFARFLVERSSPWAEVSADASGVLHSLVLDRPSRDET